MYGYFWCVKTAGMLTCFRHDMVINVCHKFLNSITGTEPSKSQRSVLAGMQASSGQGFAGMTWQYSYCIFHLTDWPQPIAMCYNWNVHMKLGRNVLKGHENSMSGERKARKGMVIISSLGWSRLISVFFSHIKCVFFLFFTGLFSCLSATKNGRTVCSRIEVQSHLCTWWCQKRQLVV